MIKTVSVIGSGTMGNGIAHTFALAGYPVGLVDVSRSRLKAGMTAIKHNLKRQVTGRSITEAQQAESLERISTYTSIERGVKGADLVIEAATEDITIKLQIFSDLSRFCKPTAILASNTSSISITKIAAASTRPEKIIGMHFMNPVPVMKLVEVIRGYHTSDATAKAIMRLAVQLNKTPVEVKDYPGFISNRILMPMINEAIQALHERVAGVAEIDTVMKLGMAHPMGPLQLADFIGLDVCLSIMNVLCQGFGNPKYSPSPLLIKMVDAGQLGIKSGIGFYDYSRGVKQPAISKRFK
jgi:3-hydroxybutyryl-CoA dehydrogenase